MCAFVSVCVCAHTFLLKKEKADERKKAEKRGVEKDRGECKTFMARVIREMPFRVGITF